MKLLVAALLLLSAASCGGRDSSDYQSFVASHDAIRPGMSVPQAFEAGLADYLAKAGGKNVPGSTLPGKQPASAQCRRHVLDVHHGSGFTIRVYCNMNGPADRQVAPQGSFQSRTDFLRGLEAYAPWAKSMSFRVESPPLKVGGVYDSYSFSTDESARVAAVSPIFKASK